jgi:hypothetical protein
VLAAATRATADVSGKNLERDRGAAARGNQCGALAASAEVPARGELNSA